MAKKNPFEEQLKKFNAKANIKTFDRETEHGVMKACRHTFKGTIYVQTEMTSTQLESVGELMIESDIFSAVGQDAAGNIQFNIGAVISHLVRKKLLRRFFTLILARDDGTKAAPEEFDGRADEFLAFASEVFAGFFTLNPNALKTIGAFLTVVFGASSMAGRLLGMALAGRS